MAMGQIPEWLKHYAEHLQAASDKGHTPREMAQLIHEALLIAEAEKYATEESKFQFTFMGGSEEEVAEIRSYLTPFENSVVVLKNRKTI